MPSVLSKYKFAFKFVKKRKYKLKIVESLTNISLVSTKDKKKDDNNIMVYTEDTGKMFEMSLCLAFDTKYMSPFKYSIEECYKLVPRIKKALEDNTIVKCKHIANNGSQYDFESICEQGVYLSAKTTKKTGSVAPQVIGQASPKKFCDVLNIDYIDIPTTKKYIQENSSTILEYAYKYTFDTKIIYRNHTKNTIIVIEPTQQIEWNNYNYLWTRHYADWNNSSTLKIFDETKNKYIPLLEVQFHTTNRTNMAIRWRFENILKLFKNNFILKYY
jgi:hypothetical protein